MTVHAVPSDRRRAVREQLEERWLAETCSWVAGIRGRGNAWSASSRARTTWLDDEGFRCEEE